MDTSTFFIRTDIQKKGKLNEETVPDQSSDIFLDQKNMIQQREGEDWEEKDGKKDKESCRGREKERESEHDTESRIKRNIKREKEIERERKIELAK